MAPIAFFFIALFAFSSALDLSHVDLNLDPNFISDWKNFLAKYGAAYKNVLESELRDIFMKNWKLIQEHNKRFALGEVSYDMGINAYSGMTREQFLREKTGIDQTLIPSSRSARSVTVSDTSAPESVDWTTKGAVTAVKNQQSCGGCWAFSATGAIEGQHYQKHKELISLSEQNLIDCASQSPGCNGGWMTTAYDYVKSNDGLDTEAQYPYTAKNNTCGYKKSPNSGVKVTGYKYLPSKDETALAQNMASVGPISVAIYVTDNFQHYKSGIFYDANCPTGVNHGVLAVGYGKSDGSEYWLVKNSWGANWGEKGYVRMARNRDNNCQIATYGNYPTVA